MSVSTRFEKKRPRMSGPSRRRSRLKWREYANCARRIASESQAEHYDTDAAVRTWGEDDTLTLEDVIPGFALNVRLALHE